MKSLNCLFAGLLLAGATVTATANDQTQIEIEVGQYYFDFKDTKGSFVAPGMPYGAASGEIDDRGAAFTLGIPLADDWSLKLRLFSAKAEEREQAVSLTGSFGMKPIDGSSAFSDGGGPAWLLGYGTKIDYQGIDVLVGKPVYSSDRQTLSLFGGISLARLEQQHNFYSLPLIGVTLGDSLDTTFFGIGMGLDHTLHLTERLKLVGNLRIDALQAKTDMSAMQNLFGLHAVSDSDRDVIGRGSLKIGLAWDFGSVSLGLNAFAEYLSDVATAEHSTVEGIVQPSRIGSDDGTIYGYNASVQFAF